MMSALTAPVRMRNPLPRFLRRGRAAAGAALALGLSGCSPLHMGMRGGMMMGTGQHPAEQPQSCQALATTVQTEAHHWSALPADSVRAFLPSHRRSVEAMLTHCAADSAGLPHDSTHAERSLIVGGIRGDLARMEQMTADNLRAFLPEHIARLDRFAALAGAARRDTQRSHDN